MVVSLQNGLEEYRIAEAVGADRTIGAVLTFGGHYEGPGRIVYAGTGSFHLGELDGAASRRLERLAAVLSAAHPVETTDRIFAHLWGKAAVGAFYVATALVDADVLTILADARRLHSLGALVAEVARVAAAEGVACEPVDGFDPAAFLRDDTDAIGASWGGAAPLLARARDRAERACGATSGCTGGRPRSRRSSDRWSSAPGSMALPRRASTACSTTSPRPRLPWRYDMNAASTSFVLREANVLDEGGGFTGPLDVHVEDGRVVAVGSNLHSRRRRPSLDFSGLFLLPGVFDCHDHISFSTSTRRNACRRRSRNGRSRRPRTHG